MSVEEQRQRINTRLQTLLPDGDPAALQQVVALIIAKAMEGGESAGSMPVKMLIQTLTGSDDPAVHAEIEALTNELASMQLGGKK
uniref:Uncharacterized protein n=1 Tax=Chromera velia CCMP2878 TaxID=1169474 RepID=A0A0G4GYT6_9ALVE|mmetsp:Transcript_47966/g.94666  ORF Transcript_47966/g.94666 Transcript_47966/m.94666 type:complete len:85 (-) Transcript_47966:513-767(-)|eukprot:Cvel_23920.t1-p1 / transcript=Cvel_23920.t1 / gene=Cvel_23920 / organism=Chromera_velia_CCMP2878 / gene_product=hypothetical protein / transcript_product=hypothetical protein / location=Cvel_scaffold2524:9569-11663(+) / protein_length=84 / sequence_SO=supercontig / SO=protein_coding / is_pseudo=false